MQRTALKLKLLAGYQILGGLVGILLMMAEVSVYPNRLIGLLGLLFMIAFFLFCFSIYSGYKLLKSYESGIHYSRINQAIQLIVFSVLGYGYSDGGRDETEIGIGVSNGWGEVGVRSGGAGDSTGTGYIAINF